MYLESCNFNNIGKVHLGNSVLGDPNIRIVKVCKSSTYFGSVCGNENEWGCPEATVTCRQLGLPVSEKESV